MILNGSVASGTMAMKLGPCNVKQRSFLAHSRLGNTPSYVSIGFGGFPKLKGLSLAHQERNVLPLRGMNVYFYQLGGTCGFFIQF